MNWLILSKNRAAQLDLLLRSMKLHGWPMESVTVVYAWTTPEFAAGYEKLISAWPSLRWKKQDHFRNDVMEAWLDTVETHTALLVDDDVCLAPLDMAEMTKAMACEDVLTYSPRLGMNVVECYSWNISTGNPLKQSFPWANYGGDLCYPGSLDGNIFRTEDLAGMRELPWSNPTNLESALMQYVTGLGRSLTYMPPKSVLVNLVVNMVQAEAPNRCPNTQTPFELNRRFLGGEQLVLPANLRPESAHIPWTHEFEKANKLKIGLILVATGKYARYIGSWTAAMRRHFLPGHDREIFCFTDAACIPKGVRKIESPHEPWPGPSLHRYRDMLRIEARLREFDFLYYVDADCSPVAEIGDEILGDLVAVRHVQTVVEPGACSVEKNPQSRAYIANPETYYAGGVQGGKAQPYLTAVKDMAEAIADDESRNIMACWFDESHWNRYLHEHAPTIVLSPLYCWPEERDCCLGRPKLLALLKRHSDMRATA